VENCNYNQRFIGRTKVRCVRKRLQKRAASVAGDDRKLLGHRTNPREHVIDVGQKARTETRSFVLVPADGLLEIGFRQRPNDEPSGHSTACY
jgi:hypothetical protein